MKRAAVTIVAVLTVMLAVGGTVAWIHGYRLYSVRTGSMTPSIPTGAMVIDAPVPDVISPGDVVTFSNGDGTLLTTHRVVTVDGSALLTKGDANAVTDPAPVAKSSVVGKVIGSIDSGGYVLVFCRQPAGVASVVTMLFALTMLHGLFFPPGPKPRHARTGHRHVSTAVAS